MKVIVSCVTEDEPAWFRKALNLVMSVRWFGGSLAKAPVIVNFVGSVRPDFERQLSAFDAEARVVQPSPYGPPPANKLRMLELDGERDFDVLLALDCDTVVTGDPSEVLPADSIMARPEGDDPLHREQWQRIFSAFEIPEPPLTTRMTASGRLTYPYFNTGVLVVPRPMCRPLRASWSRYIRDFDALYQADPNVAPTRWWSDQIGFTCAIAGRGFPIERLPVAFNFDTVDRSRHHFRRGMRPLAVLHYHNEIDDRGFLFASRNRRINPYIDRFNQRRSQLEGGYSGLVRPPLARRVLRSLGEMRWYQSRPITALRRARYLGPLHAKLRGLARGRR